jgi:hypothetical protein
MKTLDEARADFRLLQEEYTAEHRRWLDTSDGLLRSLDTARAEVECAARRATPDGCEGCDVCRDGA